MRFLIGTGSGAERMRIDSSGNVGIGTDSPAQKLDVVGKMKISDDIILAQTNGRIDYDNGVSTGSLIFYSTAGNAERMRITSGGLVQIGSDATVTPELLTVQAYSHNQAFSGKSSSSNYIWFLRNENNSGRFQLYNSSNNQTIEMTGANGNINIAGTLTEGSDVRIKENIKPLKSQLEIVNKLNPVLYNKIGFEEK